ncbi:metallophosphoesterase [Fodinicurvata sp. EGI_FJ10296]|uniref:metallophosphoesterase n=1 Tax=Fodinicurvata sp. EGI_FJ10296 TaxID=3231908 RepID=UPI003453D216
MPRLNRRPLIDPRNGDAEDDVSSLHGRSLLTIGGSLLSEISSVKLVIALVMLVILPAAALGVAPLVVTGWIAAVSRGVLDPFAGIWPLLVLFIGLVAARYFGRSLLRAAERSFWALNSLAVQPFYAMGREGIRHLVESLLARHEDRLWRARLRSLAAIGAGVLVAIAALGLAAAAWPGTRWVGSVADLLFPYRLLLPALANSVVIVAAYLAAAALVWGFADGTMDQPRDLEAFDKIGEGAGRVWRVAHLSDFHTVGGRYEFRIESGRNGPRGNHQMAHVLDRLAERHAQSPLDLIVITGDMTDAGRSSEWAEFLDAVNRHPSLAERMLMLPGNHDLNVVDRANPARLDLPTSPGKRLRQMRALSAIDAIQGSRVHVVDAETGRVGATLSDMLVPLRDDIAEFAARGTMRQSFRLAQVWSDVFPMVLPPPTADGIGVMILNSNAESHFSFTNALGVVPAEQERQVVAVAQAYPRAGWIVALHHHLVEYPMKSRGLAERIGTALINGSRFVRLLRPIAGRTLVMHGHRHFDWMGECGELRIASAPSPVMSRPPSPHFHIQRLATGPHGRLHLLPPEEVDITQVPEYG